MLLLFVLACTPTPTIDAVAPASVPAGEAITVSGTHLDEVEASLVSAERAVSLEPAGAASPESVSLRVPPSLLPGTFDLVVQRGKKQVVAAAAVQVTPAMDEVPCSDDYTANTELSLVRAEVVIDRYYTTGERDTLRLPLEQVERVEYESALDGGGACSVVFLRTKEGRRVVFHDDRTVDLHERAYLIARDMGKELVVVRVDGTAMGDEAGDPE